MATFRPGQVIRFTYRHFWPLDQNSRDPHKQIFVLHTHWENKVHGIDLKVLSADQLETLRAIMDPRNNRVRDAGFDQGIGQDFIEKVREGERGREGLQRLQSQLKNLENNMHRMQALSSTMRNPDGSRVSIPVDVMAKYNAEKQQLKRMIDQYDVAAAAPTEVDQKKLAMKPLTPMARQILKRIMPARLINNPRVFYNVVIKPLIGRVDAYRTFYRGRMDAVQVDPRWEWVQGAGNIEAPAQGIQKKEPTPRPPMKTAGAPREETPEEKGRREAFMGVFKPGKPKQPTPPQTGFGQSAMKAGTSGVVKEKKPGYIIKKPDRPR